MRDLTFPHSKPKRSLLEAAEQLFADRGFEAVSVRDITQLAGANVAAVNYHFGSRDALIELVVTRYIAPVNEERLTRLDKVERKYGNKPVPLEEIIDAFVRPLVGTVRKSELSEPLFYKLIGRIFAMQGVGIPAEIESQFKVLSERFTRALGKNLPAVPAEELVWRIHFMIGGMIHMLMQEELLHGMTQGVSGNLSMEAILSRFIRFAASGLRDGTDAEPKPKKGPQAMFDF